MMNVLVFPCGSEIALEVYRSLNKSIHFKLIGANSVSDHGRFVFENYIGNLPFVSSPDLIPYIKQIVADYSIDYIYPAMDSAIAMLKEHEDEIGCKVIASPVETTRICLSKEITYEYLKGIVEIPRCFGKTDSIIFPVFCKPKVGYGSRGAKRIENARQLEEYLNDYPDSLILELLPGEEYTVDCFTDRHRNLLFCGPRKRNRVSNGISVNTNPVNDENREFRTIVERINASIEFRGAWFVQLKRSASGKLVLLEISSRLGGSSALYRAKGINFAQLTLFDAMGYDVSIIENKYNVEMDRALDNKYKIGIEYNEVFIDYDDTIILQKQYYNTEAVQFIYQCKNKGIKVTLLSSHDGDLDERLANFNLASLFDRVIHISKSSNKACFIDNRSAIFIDDSYAERKRVHDETGIPVFSVDMIEMLMV